MDDENDYPAYILIDPSIPGGDKTIQEILPDGIDAMAAAYEEERAKYCGGIVYYTDNGAAFRGCMRKALSVLSGWRG